MILYRRMLSDYRRSLVWWAIGITVAVALIVGMYPSIKGQAGLEKMIEDLPPAVKALAGAQGGLSIISPVGYLHARLFVLILPLLLTIFGIGAGARAIGAGEGDKTLEFLLSHPVSRRQVVLERYGAVVSMVVALAGVGLVATIALSAGVGILGDVSAGKLIGAFAASTCLALLFTTLAFAAGCALGRRGPAISIPTIIAVAGYLVHSLFSLAPSLSWLRPVSPWNWYLSEVILLRGPTLISIALPLALSAACLAAGLWRFERRDLR